MKDTITTMSTTPTIESKPSSRRGKHRAAPIPYGERFGHALILGGAPSSLDGKQRVLCLCDCGSVIPFTAILSNLKSGNTTSCGCAKREAFSSYQTRQAENLSLDKCSELFHDSMDKNRHHVINGWTTGLNKYLVLFAITRYKKSLLDRFSRFFENATGSGPSRKELGLSLKEYNFLKKNVRRIPASSDVLEIDWSDLEDYQQAKFEAFAEAA